ncbi:Adiponectin receptor protein 2 [Trichoplax sp. H2]|nr:Adiponectin receptor protein 2 [Trichoplax sp. H2]|eukprot:RDD39835.1 Adiponectin receptor protein 2 [Trichoplax sp. H2]
MFDLKQNGNENITETNAKAAVEASLEKGNNDESSKIPEVRYSTYYNGKKVNVYRVVVQPPNDWKTLPFNKLPDWLQDNEFLVKGYRPQLPSVSLCLRSIFRIHTETGNIWTHLLGFIGLLIFAIYCFSVPLSQKTWQEQAVFGAFFAGAITCLLFSSFFHTIYCYSFRVMKSSAKLDYLGIATLVVGSNVSLIYYAFYCYTIPLIIYETVAIVLGTAAAIVSLFDKFSESKYRTFRAALFGGVGGSGVVPLLHYCGITGFYRAIEIGGIPWFLASGLSYLVGVTLYATRTPERFFPGRCDIVFQSHQLFHVFVVVGAILTYCSLNSYADYHQLVGHNCSVVHSIFKNGNY